MEVSQDHGLEASAEPTPVLGSIRRLSQYVFLSAVMLLPHHDGRQATPCPEDCRTPDTPSVDPSQLPTGCSLIGKRLHLQQITLDIERTGGQLQLTVNGTMYDIQEHPLCAAVSISRTIDDIRIDGATVRLHSAAHGEAHVDRHEIERVLSLLSDAQSPTITVCVVAHFTPRSETPVAAAIGLRRLWNGWKQGDPEIFEIGFVRRPPAPSAARYNATSSFSQ